MPLRAGTMHCWSLLMPLRPDKTFNDRTNRNAAVTRHMDTPHNGWIINYHNCPSWYWLTVVVKNWLMWLWLSKIVDSRLLTIWWQINTNLVPCLIYKLDGILYMSVCHSSSSFRYMLSLHVNKQRHHVRRGFIAFLLDDIACWQAMITCT